MTLRGVENAKFRRQVVPGDQLRLEVSLDRRRGAIVRAKGAASVDGQMVAEADLILVVGDDDVMIDSTARVHPKARVGAGTIIGPHAVIGPDVVLGQRCRIGASAVIDGWTTVGDESEIYPFASIGLPPQDLKYKGEPTTLEIGKRNIFREFVTIHRGTAGGGGRTTIGDGNLFMGYVHIAHDCHVGSHTIFGPHATLGGHVSVEDFANISAGSAVHQFCRVGRHAFIGGYSVVTKDALPYARTVGSRPARIFGANTIGLMRRGFSQGNRDQVEARVSLPAAVEVEYEPGTRANRAGSGARLSRGGLPGALHSHRAARGHAETRPQGGRSLRRRRMKLGLIAGNGQFPFLVLDAARAMGHDVTIVAIQDEAFPALETAAAKPPAAAVHWVTLGQLGKCLNHLERAGCTRAVMAGQVKHTKIFGGVIPDLTMLSVFARLRARNTDALIAAVADVMREHGIELLDSTSFLAPLIARSGVLTRRSPELRRAGQSRVRLPHG